MFPIICTRNVHVCTCLCLGQSLLIYNDFVADELLTIRCNLNIETSPAATSFIGGTGGSVIALPIDDETHKVINI